MRKFIALLVGSLLLIASATPVHAVTPKAGASCKKLGNKVNFNGREFTCVKKGKNRVWNRGVIVRTPVRPTPTATPTPTPTPVVTPTPSPTPSVTPSPTPSPTPSATPSPTPSVTPSPTPSPTPTPTPVVTPTPSPTPVATPSPTTTTSSSTGTREYTRAEVALRRTADNCWAIIDGNVYDLTRWISQHPGGRNAILGICGVDGTEDFQNSHSTARPFSELANYLIGKVSLAR